MVKIKIYGFSYIILDWVRVFVEVKVDWFNLCNKYVSTNIQKYNWMIKNFPFDQTTVWAVIDQLRQT